MWTPPHEIGRLSGWQLDFKIKYSIRKHRTRPPQMSKTKTDGTVPILRMRCTRTPKTVHPFAAHEHRPPSLSHNLQFTQPERSALLEGVGPSSTHILRGKILCRANVTWAHSTGPGDRMSHMKYGEKRSSSQAEPGQAIKSAVA